MKKRSGYLLTLGRGSGEVFDYYVDPSTTSSGAGTIASPYTVAQLNALSGSIANKRIGLKNGSWVTADTLNPTIALSDNALYVGVYGPGAGVTIDLRKTISGAWTSLGSNLWRHTGTQVSDGSASGNVFRNGIPMKLVQTTPAADGEAVVAVWNWQGVRGVTSTTSFSVDIYSVADPTSDGYTYTYSSSTYAIQLSGNNCTIAGKSGALITAKGSLHQGGAFRLTGASPTIRYARVEHGSRHAILVGPNALVEDCQFYGGRNRQENGAFDHVVCNTTAFGGSDTLTLRRNSYSTDTYMVAGSDTCAPFYSHDSGSGRLLTCTSESETFGAYMAGISPRATTTTVTSPVYSSAWGMVEEGADTATISFIGATGTVGRILSINNGAGTLTFNTTSCTLTLTGSRFTGAQHFQINQQNGGGVLVWNSTNDVLTNSDGTGSLRYVTFVAKLTLTVNGSSFPGTWDKMYACQTTLVFAGNNNNYKSGKDSFETPAGNKTTLALWKTYVSPEDAASTATA